MIRSLVSRISNKFNGLASRVTAVAAIPAMMMANAYAAGSTAPTNISALGKNVTSILKMGSTVLTNVSTVAGLGLFFLGIFNLYTSHTKQASGGKPMSHGLVMLGCGALLIGLPYVFSLAGNSVIGTHAIGGSISQINGTTS